MREIFPTVINTVKGSCESLDAQELVREGKFTTYEIACKHKLATYLNHSVREFINYPLSYEDMQTLLFKITDTIDRFCIEESSPIRNCGSPYRVLESEVIEFSDLKFSALVSITYCSVIFVGVSIKDQKAFITIEDF